MMMYMLSFDIMIRWNAAYKAEFKVKGKVILFNATNDFILCTIHPLPKNNLRANVLRFSISRRRCQMYGNYSEGQCQPMCGRKLFRRDHH